ncbi:uncharacterized protein LOC113233520 [Hyposmocoma kahamanoa]|uniref:uncharacterized protein LOC113233520 n=1 Tax=Hyposmocoma kahamanoa TaxID=1477025 RepID=UPI000E6D5F3A|nr:uncharacterized protein LOC113233520 [Hyposmocoma kahamanoa]
MELTLLCLIYYLIEDTNSVRNVDSQMFLWNQRKDFQPEAKKHEKGIRNPVQVSKLATRYTGAVNRVSFTYLDTEEDYHLSSVSSREQQEVQTEEPEAFSSIQTIDQSQPNFKRKKSVHELPKNYKNEIEAGELANMVQNKRHFVPMKYDYGDLGRRFMLRDPYTKIQETNNWSNVAPQILVLNKKKKNSKKKHILSRHKKHGQEYFDTEELLSSLSASAEEEEEAFEVKYSQSSIEEHELPKNYKNEMEAGELANMVQNKRHFVPMKYDYDDLGRRFMLRDPYKIQETNNLSNVDPQILVLNKQERIQPQPKQDQEYFDKGELLSSLSTSTEEEHTEKGSQYSYSIQSHPKFKSMMGKVNKNEKDLYKNYENEIQAGELADMVQNKRHFVPMKYDYDGLGRRFMLRDPYTKVQKRKHNADQANEIATENTDSIEVDYFDIDEQQEGETYLESYVEYEEHEKREANNSASLEDNDPRNAYEKDVNKMTDYEDKTAYPEEKHKYEKNGKSINITSTTD